MRQSILMFLFIFCPSGIHLFAQSSIVEVLQEDVQGQGTIRVYASSAINSLVGSSETLTIGSAESQKNAGYRVQVYSGNQQRYSKTEALGKQRELNEVFPEYVTYVKYNAPYWRIRIGDCSSFEEAYFLMKRISKALPALKKEMYIVKDDIKPTTSTNYLE